MRASFAVVALIALSGCDSIPPAIVQPPGPTSATAVQVAAAVQDNVDGKVAAAVTVARENLDKPKVADQELGVALSLLDKPSESELALARQRSERASAADYDAARKFGQKLLASLDAAQARIKADQEAAAKASAAKDARIADLSAELARVKAEGPRQTVLAVSGVCFLAALVLGLIGQYVRAGVSFAMGTLTASLPILFDSKWFVPTLGGLLICVVAAEAVALFLRTRRPSPDAEAPAKV